MAYFKATPTIASFDTPHLFVIDPEGKIVRDWADSRMQHQGRSCRRAEALMFAPAKELQTLMRGSHRTLSWLLMQTPSLPIRSCADGTTCRRKLADAADVLSDQLRVHLQRLAVLLEPHTEKIERKFLNRLRALGFEPKQRLALSAITPGRGREHPGAGSSAAEIHRAGGI